MIATLFAIITFLPSPIIKRLNPSVNFCKVTFLLDNCFSIVSYLTIGPAISCGNNAIYAPKVMIFF